jgi:hypothetical protein
VLILLALVVAARAEPAPFDPTVPTCRGWWTLAADDRGPTRPVPVPHVGAGCPPGYSSVADVRHVRAGGDHPVPRLPVVRIVPGRVDVLADVALLRRDELQVN